MNSVGEGTRNQLHFNAFTLPAFKKLSYLILLLFLSTYLEQKLEENIYK
jgi:hypothetical protein